MSININASSIINNLMANNNYQFASIKRTVTFNEEVDEAKTNTADFKRALRGLKNIDTSSGGTAAVKNKINKFVKSYNNFIDSASSVDSKKMEKYLSKMDSLFEEYEDELKDIGITKTTKNKLKFDTTDFSEVTSKQLDAVFGKDKSFVEDTMKYAKFIYRTTTESLTTPVNELSSTTITLSAANSALAQSSGKLASCIQSLLSTDYTEDSRESIVAYLKSFVENYNNTISDSDSASLNSTEGTLIEMLKKVSNDNSSDLSNVGIDVNDSGTLSFDESTASSAELDSIESLFENNSASYGCLVKNYSESLFASLVNADSSGLSINYYA